MDQNDAKIVTARNHAETANLDIVYQQISQVSILRFTDHISRTRFILFSKFNARRKAQLHQVCRRSSTTSRLGRRRVCHRKKDASWPIVQHQTLHRNVHGHTLARRHQGRPSLWSISRKRRTSSLVSTFRLIKVHQGWAHLSAGRTLWFTLSQS